MLTFRVAALLLAVLAYSPLTAYGANAIQLENAKPGTRDWLHFSSADNREIEGYASATSVAAGETIRFYVSAIESTYRINVYRLGWYGGLGGRHVFGPVTRTGFQQVTPEPDPVTGLIACNWTDPYSLVIPSDWTTGVYLAKLTLPTSRKESFIPFVVRDDASRANHYMQLSVTTWQAYNQWGGKSLYSRYSIGEPADKVSFDRPYRDGNGTGQLLWRWEYNLIRFLEREGYDVAYCTNIDTHARPSLMMNHQSFLSTGHDEYWSMAMRDNVEGALAAGVDLAFITANAAYWQVRFEPNAAGAPHRVMVSYKEDALTKDPFALDADASNDRLITTQFRAAPVNRPESALIGVQYGLDPVDADIVIDDVTSAPWVFEHTNLTTGSILPGLLGYEIDAMTPHTPAGTIRLAHSPFVTNNEAKRSGHANMVVRTTPNGAVVFATGTIQWPWGLDDWNSGDTGQRVNAAAQQITRNVLLKMAGNSADADCQFTVSPMTVAATKAAGSALLTLTTARNCSWTLANNTQWLTVSGPTSGSGNAEITVSWPENRGAERSGTLRIADKTVTVTQATGCTFSFTPANASFPAQGGSGSIDVTTSSADCMWTATPSSSWVTITSGATGSVSGRVEFTVAANSGTSRDANIRINGERFDIYQANGCTYSVSPLSAAFNAAASEGTFAITTDATCHWRASSSLSWAVVTSSETGSGNATVRVAIAQNTTGAARTGTISIAGAPVTLAQSADDCTYRVTPAIVNRSAAAGTGTIEVAPSGGCAWTATVTSGSFFVTLTQASGSGRGTIGYTVAENTSSTGRTATITVGDKTISLTQGAAGQAPFGITATATSSTTANIAWPSIAGATQYVVYRGESVRTLAATVTVTSTSFADSGLRPATTYVYRIRALNGTAVIAYSDAEIATTLMFTDPVLTARSTQARAIHQIELRQAVNAVRSAAVLSPYPFSEAIGAGTTIRASHIQQLRAAIDEARAVIGLPPLVYAHPVTIGSPPRTADVQELRAGTQ